MAQRVGWRYRISGCLCCCAFSDSGRLARYGSATHFNIIPEVSWGNLNFWSQIAFAMVGLELAPILGGEIYDADQNCPARGLDLGAACAAFYMAGTAAHAGAAPAGPDQSHDRSGASRRCGWSAIRRRLALTLLRPADHSRRSGATQHLISPATPAYRSRSDWIITFPPRLRRCTRAGGRLTCQFWRRAFSPASSCSWRSWARICAPLTRSWWT